MAEDSPTYSRIDILRKPKRMTLEVEKSKNIKVRTYGRAFEIVQTGRNKGYIRVGYLIEGDAEPLWERKVDLSNLNRGKNTLLNQIILEKKNVYAPHYQGLELRQDGLSLLIHINRMLNGLNPSYVSCLPDDLRDLRSEFIKSLFKKEPEKVEEFPYKLEYDDPENLGSDEFDGNLDDLIEIVKE